MSVDTGVSGVAEWMEDLESEEAARALAAERLARLLATTPRARVFLDAAKRWLDRGQGRVALALLDRVDRVRPEVSAPTQRELPVETLQLGLPGFGGLPALTEEEADALRACATPEEALAVIARARRRLDEHGREAHRLLRRWLDRSRTQS